MIDSLTVVLSSPQYHGTSRDGSRCQSTHRYAGMSDGNIGMNALVQQVVAVLPSTDAWVQVSPVAIQCNLGHLGVVHCADAGAAVKPSHGNR